MTRPHDKWTSREIAQHTARAEAEDLSALWATPERPILTRCDRIIIAVCVIAVLCLIARAVFGMEIPEPPYTGPGYENCKGSC